MNRSNNEIYPNYHGIIAKTTDGGISWFHQADGVQTSIFDDLFFVDKNEGWVVGHTTDANPILLKTTNGGNDWASQHIYSNISSIWFADSSVGYLAGESGLILKTTDNGSFWSEQSSGLDENLFDSYFKIN